MGVNPENGVMDKEEPLKTLKSYENLILPKWHKEIECYDIDIES